MNKFLFSRFLKKERILFLLLMMLNYISSIAQTTYTCSGYPAFTYGRGACGTSIQVDAVVPLANSGDYIWYVGTDPDYQNNPQVSSGNNACIPVSTPNILYYITLALDDQVNNSLNYSTCSYTVPSGYYIQGVDPSTPIKKAIDTHLPVGTIKGSNLVTLTGGASYDIPIAVPKGTAGVEPSLSITYGSQGGIGLMGMGWNLSVGSSISRVPRDLYHDDVPSAPTLWSGDAYALDGNRLVLVTGNYGADGSTYQTKNESFSRITLKGSFKHGPEYFIVESKNGMTMEYGFTPDAKIRKSSNAHIALWQLNKVTDPNGNYMTYHYYNANNNMLLQEIRYTGNLTAKINPYNSIKFDYEAKKDNNIGYLASTPIADSYLLAGITITAEGQLFRKYEFDYVFDNIHSYLRAARVAGSDNVFLNATEFKYGDIGQEFYADKVNINNQIIGIAPYYDNTTGDFNGDGLSDLLQLKYNVVKGQKIFESFKTLTKNQGSNTFNTANTIVTLNQGQQVFYEANDGIAEQINFISQDFNGDGFDDVPVANIDRDLTGGFYHGVSGQWVNTYSPYYIKTIDIHHSKGDGNFDLPISYAASVGNYQYKANSVSKNFIITGDFDGDSKADYVTILSNGTDFKVFVSFPNNNNLNNEVTGSLTLPVSHPYLYSYLGTALSTANFVKSIDFNGDGKSEICVVRDNWISVVEITLNNGLYKGTEIEFLQIPKNININNINFGDFNGDRKTDILLSLISDSKTNHKVYLSDGDKYIASYDVRTQTNNEDINISDFNGDGMSDICFTSLKNTNIQDKLGNWSTKQDYQYKMHYSKGIDFFDVVNSYSNIIAGQYTVVANEPVTAIGDFNGDGKSEIISTTGVYASFFPNSTNHLLEKAVDGYNREISFTYSNATANAVFGKGIIQKYPLNSVQLPMFLVSAMNEPDGVGGISSTFYRYDNATLHRRGIGFMGFGHTEATNNISDVKTESFFEFKDKLIPSNGKTNFSTLLSLTKVFKGTDLVSETSYTNEVRDRGNGRTWTVTPATTSHDFITDVKSTSNSEYDTYGNVVAEKVDVAGVQTTTTSAIYEQHGSWIPSSPVSSTVSSTRQGAPSFSKKTTRIFNSQGNVETEIEFDGNPKAVQTESKYYPTGLPEVVTMSAAGVKTKTNTFEYDPNFRHLIKTTNSLGQTASSSFDARWSKPLSITDIGGLTISYEYDPLGREKAMTPPQGYTIQTSYNWGGQGLYNILVEHPTKPDSREHFDIFERSFAKEMEHFKGGWLKSSQVFDNKGRVSSKTSAAGVVTDYEYYTNTAERLKSTDNGIGQTLYKYQDSNGETETEVTTTAGHIYTSTTDAVGKLIKKIDNGGTLDYEYDSQGNTTKIKLDGKQISLVQYDGVGHRTSFTEISAGTTAYKFDAFGQLIYQKTPKGFETFYEYTVLGQVDNRKGAEGVTTYDYIQVGAAINNIETVKGFNGYDQISSYDGLGRIETYTEITDGIKFTHSYEYDPVSGNPIKETYPTGFFITREFDQNSYLERVISDKGTVIFDGLAVDAYGNYTNYNLGNGLSTSNTFDKYGFPVGFSTSGALDLAFDFEQKSGNLLSRSDKGKGLSEEFGYDNLDRLVSVSGSGQPLKIDYSQNGNIENKTDIGTYEYKKTKVNAVQKITRPKGFRDIAVVQPISYTPFDQPDEVSEGEGFSWHSDGGSRHYNFTYGADYQRRMMEHRRGVTITTGHTDPNTSFVHDQVVEERRYYVGNYEEFRVAPSEKNPEEQIFNIHYIEGGDGVCAILLRKGEIDSMFYVYKDYLGSFLTFTGEKGGVVYEQNFDAWGNYRNIEDWSYVKKNHIPLWLRRGYTGHEHLIRFEPHAVSYYNTATNHTMFMPFNIINMNGRIYDPMIGRMMSPDNYAHDGAGSQGYNRYSYANNNPLKYNDPDGNFWNYVGGAVVGGVYNVGMNWSKIKGWKQGAAYFVVGAAAGTAVASLNPVAARAILIGGNAVIHAATGHLPNVDFKNAPGQSLLNLGLYSLETVGNAYGGVAVAGLGARGLPQLINGWRTWFTGSYGGKIVVGEVTEQTIVQVTISAERTTVGQAASQAAAGTTLELAAVTIENSVSTEAAKQGGLNLFKHNSAQALKETGWKSSDRFLKMYNKGTPKLNWKQNSGFLRQEIKLNNPIFDSFIETNGALRETGGFLNAERYLLQSRGWSFDLNMGAWLPPF